MNSFKSILFISINDHVPWGGSEVLWYKTAKNLALVNKVQVLVKKWQLEPQPIKKLKALGADVFYKYTQNPSLKERILKKVFKKDFKKQHCLEQKGLEKPELVIVSLGNHLDIQLFYYTDYLIKNHIKYAIVCQLVTDLRGLDDILMNRFRESYINATKLYFLSQDNVDKTEMQFSTAFKNKELINNPFEYKPVNTALVISGEGKYYLGCVASLNSLHKGLDVFLKALYLDKWKQRQLYINLYGDGNNKEQITRLIDLYGLQDKVSLIGFVSNKEDIWKYNHGLILPSRMEGQSLAMLEAMAHGRMVISTKVGDAERLVKDRETGFLIDAPTVELIDRVLENAWEEKDNWIEMGKLSQIHLFNIIKTDPVVDFSEKLQTLLK